MNKRYFSNTALVAVLAVALAVCRVLRTCIPFGVLPELDIPNMVLISGVALLLDHHFGGQRKNDLWLLLFAAVTYSILPVAAGFAQLTQSWKLALTGGVLFWVMSWIFGSIEDRLTTGPAAKAAPFASALSLYLAIQALMGMFL